MNIELLREYYLAKPGASETLPFGPDTLVFKVMDKIFLLIGLESPHQFNVKCDPQRAIMLREQFAEIKPGYHMNKKHWNTVLVNGTLSPNFITGLIDHSYDLVVAGVPKNKRS